MNSNVVGLDTAKSIFHLYSQAGSDKPVKKKLKRAEMLSYFANLPVSLIGLEACSGAHYWARELAKLGCANTATPANQACHAPNRRVVIVVIGASK